MQLSAILDSYESVRLLRPGSLRLYRLAIASFARLVGDDVACFTDTNLTRFARARLAAGVCAHTIHGEQSKLQTLWRYAAQNRWVERFPVARKISRPVRIPEAWTRGQLDQLFGVLDAAMPVGSCHGGDWWRALLLTLWDSGERISAVLQLDWPRVDFARGTILVPAEHTKTGKADCRYQLAADTLDAIGKLPREYPPFALPFDRGTLYNRLSGLLKAAGLPADRRSKFHRIRRSFASHLTAAGGDATAALGHSSPAVTRLYLDPTVCGGPAPVTFLFRPATGQPSENKTANQPTNDRKPMTTILFTSCV